MEYSEMKVDFLGAARVIDNFIGGVMEPYSYEDYLRDFVNCSSYFLKKSNGKLYKKPESEAHGEYDCASDEYKLDFKLFASQSKLQAAKILSPSIQEFMPGVIGFGLPEKHEGVPGYKPITYSIPYAVFRSLNWNKMIEIREKKEKEDVLEKDVSQIIKTFETKKNIMLFFPYDFNFNSNDNFEHGRKLAIDGLNVDFKYLFQYRMDRLPEYDTYVSFIYEKENFVITKWTGDKLEFVEMIPVYKSSLYCELWHIAEG